MATPSCAGSAVRSDGVLADGSELNADLVDKALGLKVQILIATGGAQGAIRRHGHGVQLAVVPTNKLVHRRQLFRP